MKGQVRWTPDSQIGVGPQVFAPNLKLVRPWVSVSYRVRATNIAEKTLIELFAPVSATFAGCVLMGPIEQVA